MGLACNKMSDPMLPSNKHMIKTTEQKEPQRRTDGTLDISLRTESLGERQTCDLGIPQTDMILSPIMD
jgi:hypothetical protein